MPTGLPDWIEQGLVVFEPAQAGDDRVIALPVARGAADAAIDDQFLAAFGDIADRDCSSACAAALR
jgi:hypothetical protein